MDKKSQGLSITTIIVVAIGLIVLVVLVAVFTGRVGQFGQDVDTSRSCESACSGLGMSKAVDAGGTDSCTTSGQKYIAGSFNDADSEDVDDDCCCA